MPDLLLELRSEEIPARMQRKAAGDLRKMVTDGLVEAGLTYEAAREYWTPRRLALDVRGLTARSKDVREEKKGPRTDAPEQAIQGFLRSAGLSSVSEAEIVVDPKKGSFYVATTTKPGRAAEEIIAELVPAVVRAFPWPKSMRWGKASAKPGSLRWVRPLQSILCTFGPETEEPVVVDFDIDGIRSGNVTYGHRFHAPEAITVRRFADYVARLEAAKVVLDAERRKEIIRADAQNLAFAGGLELVEDEGLLEEVSGLVEWPVVLMGEFEQDYLQIPAEVIRLTIRANQKCFVTRPQAKASSPHRGEGGSRSEPGEGALSNRFVLTANIEASDGGGEIARGNGKVVRARLSDALYFWKTDQSDLPDLDVLEETALEFHLNLRKPLDQRMARLSHLNVTFHAKLGTQGERVRRIKWLAEEIAYAIGADNNYAVRAASLAKADLQTEVVGEFPELQGAMGRKYALLQGEHPSVAAAIEEHYKPQGPSDSIPTDPVSIAVALADKLDTLVGFWAIDEKPTGSKDPYALRRAALGLIRIVAENGVKLGLAGLLSSAHELHLRQARHCFRLIMRDPTDGNFTYLPTWKNSMNWASVDACGKTDIRASDWAIPTDVELRHYDGDVSGDSIDATFLRIGGDQPSRARIEATSYTLGNQQTLRPDLLSFFHDRLKVYLRDKGARHDLIDAIITPDADDLLSIVRKVEALGSLLDTEAGKNLLAGTKRAANILAAEEKKGTAIAPAVDPALFSQPAETALFAAVNQAEKEAAQAIQGQDFSAAMRALGALREPVDSFFEDVLVNDEDAAVRANRLALLARIRAATGQVADFSKIAG